MSVSARFGDLEADVVEALALVGQEAGHAGRVVRRLDELDLRLPDSEERDRHPVRLDREHELERQAEHVAPERERLVDVPHDDRDVMDLAQAPDVVGHLRRAAAVSVMRILLRQTVMSSRWTPQATRRRSAISPTVA